MNSLFKYRYVLISDFNERVLVVYKGERRNGCLQLPVCTSRSLVHTVLPVVGEQKHIVSLHQNIISFQNIVPIIHLKHPDFRYFIFEFLHLAFVDKRCLPQFRWRLLWGHKPVGYPRSTGECIGNQESVPLSPEVRNKEISCITNYPESHLVSAIINFKLLRFPVRINRIAARTEQGGLLK